ncbi:hypothetical protein [Donghicola eburneus]|uniref:hypothetical protein n=1 Tax=Donghicola eburneus TaxID=393278 RepID=UPI0008EBAF14|nr:hypothetical protein [Donghicola eburneus]SFQ52338.1 hypothetical protein SAMN05421764_105117 [Donghicola eburneus]
MADVFSLRELAKLAGVSHRTILNDIYRVGIDLPKSGTSGKKTLIEKCDAQTYWAWRQCMSLGLSSKGLWIPIASCLRGHQAELRACCLAVTPRQARLCDNTSENGWDAMIVRWDDIDGSERLKQVIVFLGGMPKCLHKESC